MYLLSIDPGSSRKGVKSDTGIVVMKVPRKDQAYLVDSWTVKNGIDGFRYWDSRYDWLEVAHTVVVEHFQDRQILGADRTPMLIEGAVRFMREDAILSSPSGYKTLVPEPVLEKFGMVFEGDHHRDRVAASRHALKWLLQNHEPTAEFGWGHLK